MTKDSVGIDAIRGSGHDVNPDKTPPKNWRLAILVAVGCGLVGLALRYVARQHATDDAIQHLIPWYVFARDHGVAGLAEAFTNYTPFYSYLLLIAARFDWLGQPLSLVKAISADNRQVCVETDIRAAAKADVPIVSFFTRSLLLLRSLKVLRLHFWRST